MKHRAFYFLIIFTICIGAILIYKFKPSQNPAITAPLTVITRKEYQKKIVSLINEVREKDKLRPLKENPELDISARNKALDMFAKNYWAHDSPDGAKPWLQFIKAGYIYQYAGENLARDFSTPEGTVLAWMNSLAHKSAILNPEYTDTGVWVGSGKLNNKETLLVVEHLAAN